MKTINETASKIKELKSEILERARTCVKGQNFVMVTKNLNVSVWEDNTHGDALIGFPAQCSEKRFDQQVNDWIDSQNELNVWPRNF